MQKDKLTNILNKITEWSLYLLIFFLPLSKTLIEICIIVASFSWIAKKILLKSFSLKKTPINTALFALFIVSAISIINADFKMLAMRSLVSKCLKYIILYFVVIETIDSEIKLKNLLKMALISAVIIMIDGYLQYFVLHKDIFRGYPPFKYRLYPPPIDLGYPTASFPFPNDLSAWIIVICMPAVTLCLWGMKERCPKSLLALFLCPFLFLFYLTNARGAFLGFFVSFFLLLITQNKKKIIAIILLVALATLPFLPREKINHIFEPSSMQDRFYMWGIGWRIFAEHPIIGNGINMFFSKFQEFRDDKYKNKRGSYAHNGYLQIAAETGLIGLFVFLFLLGKVFYSVVMYARKNKNIFSRALSIGLAGGLLAFLIHSFFDTNLQSLPLATLFWFGTAVLMSTQNIYASKA